jgi:hypothetical protein
MNIVMSTLESPANESCRKNVSFELRKGTCFDLAKRLCMQSPSDERDLLMFCASLSCCPCIHIDVYAYIHTHNAHTHTHMYRIHIYLGAGAGKALGAREINEV